MKRWAAALSWLNVIDAMATMYEVRQLGISIEANPLMTRLLWNPEFFAGVKIIGMEASVLFLSMWATESGFRGHASRLALRGGCGMYVIAAAVHMYVLFNMQGVL